MIPLDLIFSAWTDVIGAGLIMLCLGIMLAHSFIFTLIDNVL
jgi:hypothetical protein